MMFENEPSPISIPEPPSLTSFDSITLRVEPPKLDTAAVEAQVIAARRLVGVRETDAQSHCWRSPSCSGCRCHPIRAR